METPPKQSMPGICATFHQSDPMRSIAYTSEDIKWCEATIDFLEGQLSHEAPAVRSIPPAKRARHSRAAAAAPSPAPASEPKSAKSSGSSTAPKLPAKVAVVSTELSSQAKLLGIKLIALISKLKHRRRRWWTSESWNVINLVLSTC